MKALRIALSIAISGVFAWATLTRVDLAEAGAAFGRAALPGLALAFGFAWLEIAVRAWRWRFLLSPLGKVGYSHVFAYTCIGYFTNTLLPMRLGDVARAYLAATALRMPRLGTLGSVVVERLIDGLTTLMLAAALSWSVLGASSLAPAAFWAAPAALLLVLVCLGAVLAGRRRSPLELVPARARELAGRLVAGTDAVRTPRGAATAVAYTLAAYGCAVAALMAAAGAVGIGLTPVQAAFAMSWIALSTAIPAAPGSIGTYEFVGVSVLTMLGQDPASALAAVVLLHVLGTVPVALTGLGITWALHLRVWRIGEAVPSGTEPAGQTA